MSLFKAMLPRVQLLHDAESALPQSDQTRHHHRVMWSNPASWEETGNRRIVPSQWHTQPCRQGAAGRLVHPTYLEHYYELLCRYMLPSQQHMYMEPHVSVAEPDEDDTILVWSSTQTPDACQKAVADVLGLPYHNVRVSKLPCVPFSFRSSACSLTASSLSRLESAW